MITIIIIINEYIILKAQFCFSNSENDKCQNFFIFSLIKLCESRETSLKITCVPI